MPLATHPTQQVTISRAGATTDAEGRPTASVVAASVLGLVIELSATERPQGGTLGEETTAQALLPYGTDVRVHDTLTATYVMAGLTRAFRVVAVHDCVVELLVDLHRDG